MMDPLISISPLDGRYRDKLEELAEYFSEYALIRARVHVELEWFVFLCNKAKLPGTRVLSSEEVRVLRAIYKDLDHTDAERVKDFEKTTNHDVKAVEYFIKEHMAAYPKIAALSEFVHFACTSEDINNLSYSLILNGFLKSANAPMLGGVVMDLYQLALRHKSLPMLARTHGQPASPTTLGKEMIVFVARLERQMALLSKCEVLGKINGATGNFNAHMAAYPNLDWIKLSKQFVESLGFTWNEYTTQIEPHDYFAEIFHAMMRINTILIDLCRDMWTYISIGYFTQKLKEGEVGSSTMPHKVNPIDFENAEGNLGLANAIFGHLAEKLPISRMQRDLTDSTVSRNIGVACAHTVLAYKSLLKGLSKLSVNKEKLAADLDSNWEVLTEAIQTVLRRHGVPNAYEKLKKLSRGKALNRKDLKKFISGLEIPVSDKKRLISMTPSTYIGLAEKLVESYSPEFFKV